VRLDGPRERTASSGPRGLALAGLGERDPAIASGRRAVEVYPSSLDALDGPEYVLELARIFVMLGDLDGAIDQLTVYLSGLGVWSLPGLLVDPVFRGLADHPRYPEPLTVQGHR